MVIIGPRISRESLGTLIPPLPLVSILISSPSFCDERKSPRIFFPGGIAAPTLIVATGYTGSGQVSSLPEDPVDSYSCDSLTTTTTTVVTTTTTTTTTGPPASPPSFIHHHLLRLPPPLRGTRHVTDSPSLLTSDGPAYLPPVAPLPLRRGLSRQVHQPKCHSAYLCVCVPTKAEAVCPVVRFFPLFLFLLFSLSPSLFLSLSLSLFLFFSSFPR